jgi:tetratricopeptide (TPR) repeat protein
VSGQRIGTYEAIEEIARGGMGVVFRARDQRDGREVALKVQLPLGDGARARRAMWRFHTEATVLRRLQHPNLVPVLDAGEAPQGSYLAMELVEGKSLGQALEANGPFAPREAARIARSLAEALDCAHASGVLHRDVKPDNVLLTEGGVPRLTDFGLAKDLEASIAGQSLATQEGGFLGSPGYLPPEQAFGELDQIGPTSDVYGVGATLFAMLTGEPPYTGDSLVEVVGAMQGSLPDPRERAPGVDADLAALCRRCLARDPNDRPGSARELSDALQAYLRGERREPRSRPLLPPLAAAGAVALMVLAAGISKWSEEPTAVQTPQVAEQPVAETPAPEAPEADAPATEPVPEPAATGPEPREQPGTELRHPQLESDDGEANRWFQQGQFHAQREDRELAIQAYTEALALDPHYTAARYNRALLYSEAEAFEGAISDLEACVQLFPGWIPAWQELARVLALAGRSADAVQAYDVALRLQPEWAVGYYQRGLLRDEAGDDEGAIADYGAALDLDPTIAVAYVNRGVLRDNAGDHAGALADYDRAIALDPMDPVIHCNRGVAQRKAGDVVRAIEDFSRALALDPNYQPARIARGQAFAANDQWARAGEDFDKALTFAPDHPRLVLNRGLCRKRTGDQAGARADFERVLTLLPDDHPVAKKARKILETLTPSSDEP